MKPINFKGHYQCVGWVRAPTLQVFHLRPTACPQDVGKRKLSSRVQRGISLIGEVPRCTRDDSGGGRYFNPLICGRIDRFSFLFNQKEP